MALMQDWTNPRSQVGNVHQSLQLLPNFFEVLFNCFQRSWLIELDILALQNHIYLPFASLRAHPHPMPGDLDLLLTATGLKSMNWTKRLVHRVEMAQFSMITQISSALFATCPPIGFPIFMKVDQSCQSSSRDKTSSFESSVA